MNNVGWWGKCIDKSARGYIVLPYIRNAFRKRENLWIVCIRDRQSDAFPASSKLVRRLFFRELERIASSNGLINNSTALTFSKSSTPEVHQEP